PVATPRSAERKTRSERGFLGCGNNAEQTLFCYHPPMSNELPTGLTRLKNGKYAVRASINKKLVRVGTYNTLEEAVDARASALGEVGKPKFKPDHMIAVRTLPE